MKEQLRDHRKRPRVINVDPFLTVNEAAEYCSVSAAFIYERVYKKEIEATRIHRMIRIRLSSLNAFLEQGRQIKTVRSRAV